MQKFLRAAALIAVSFSLLPAHSYLAAQTTTTTPTVADTVTAQVARLTKLLTLTTAQANQATSLFTTEVTALNTISASVTTAQTALTTAVEANSTSGITAAANSLGTLAAQRAQAEGTAQAAFYAILTTAQQTVYKELLAAGLDCAGGSGGPGGPGGPGGGHH
jgi:Spy/CpxP family protein refolding chaperone